MRGIDFEGIRSRIADERSQVTTETAPDESADEINRRIFEGGDLPDLAARMFRH